MYSVIMIYVAIIAIQRTNNVLITHGQYTVMILLVCMYGTIYGTHCQQNSKLVIYIAIIAIHRIITLST